MTLRLYTILTGLLALITAALLALAPANANPTSGGYRLFEPVASEHQVDIQLASLGNFAPRPETASEYANAPNRGDDVAVITQNRIRHNQAVEDANAQFNANGLTTRTEVTLESCTGTRCRADTVIQGEAGQTSTSVPEGFTAYDLDGNRLDSIPLGSNGQGIAIVETKTGNAILSGNQSVGYPEVSQGTVSGVGNNANSANLGGAVPADTPIVILTPE